MTSAVPRMFHSLFSSISSSFAWDFLLYCFDVQGALLIHFIVLAPIFDRLSKLQESIDAFEILHDCKLPCHLLNKTIFIIFNP